MNGKRLIAFLTLIVLAVLAVMVFWPRKYPSTRRDGSVNTEVWRLAAGYDIAYTHVPASGQDKKPFPVIYLHGGPGGSISKAIIDVLSPLAADGFDLYFYDQVGGGASSRLHNISAYTVGRHVRDLDEIREKIHADKIILVGQSWGAILAAAYLAEHPDNVERIIFTGPGPIYPGARSDQFRIPAPDSLRLRAPYTTNAAANKAASNVRVRTISSLATRFGWKMTSDEEMDAYGSWLQTLTDKSALCDSSLKLMDRGGFGYYASIMTLNDLVHMPSFRNNLRGNKLPVLVMKGQCDNQPWGATSDYLDLFPNHRFVMVPGAGHFIHIEQPTRYLHEIWDFLVE